ncbi:hypothetical protein HHI36_008311 [Cryptolaemus montrouzieri]|uniref:RING-type domain-containing protein n=1 Tax=Cryptolaemus montrouzieri TaxID=559131 RepID=A0ABD2MS84_9CUCU
MDIIDANSYVIDPSDRLRKYNFRRIWLQENVCVIITIDPFSVNTCPHFAFLGPDRLVNEFRSELNKNLEEWNNSGDIFCEILQVLGIEKFPGKSYMSEHCTTELLKEDSDCSICFCSDLNGKLPEIVCNNKCCENFYHKDCLYEWLLSINSKKFLMRSKVHVQIVRR